MCNRFLYDAGEYDTLRSASPDNFGAFERSVNRVTTVGGDDDNNAAKGNCATRSTIGNENAGSQDRDAAAARLALLQQQERQRVNNSNNNINNINNNNNLVGNSDDAGGARREVASALVIGIDEDIAIAKFDALVQGRPAAELVTLYRQLLLRVPDRHWNPFHVAALNGWVRTYDVTCVLAGVAAQERCRARP